MAKLPPRLTGLPMTVWIRPNEGFPHDLRVKVSRTHGRGCWPYVASVAVRPQPREIARQSDDGRFRGRRPLDRSQSGGDRRLLGRLDRHRRGPPASGPPAMMRRSPCATGQVYAARAG